MASRNGTRSSRSRPSATCIRNWKTPSRSCRSPSPDSARTSRSCSRNTSRGSRKRRRPLSTSARPVAACTRSSDNPVAAEGPRSRLSTWLLRPYLDLGPLHAGPLHASALDECWRAFADPSTSPFLPQRALPPGFRAQLAEEAGPPYALSDPRELPEGLRTDRWRELCGALDGWSDLSGDRKCRLASLLHSLCLYQPLLALIPEGAPAELAFWRASAKFMQNLPHRISDYDDADMSVFEELALRAPDVVPVGFNATAMVFVHKAKTGAAVQDLEEWARRFEAALGLATRSVDQFTAELFTSRFHRG